MRLLLLLIFLVGCSSPEVKTQSNEDQAVDSILKQSERSFVAADSIGRESDEFINSKVTKTVQQISTLKEEVKVLKSENNVLKIKVSDADDAGEPFKLLPVSGGKDNRE